MAKTTFLTGILGKLLQDKMIPEPNLGALADIVNQTGVINQNRSPNSTMYNMNTGDKLSKEEVERVISDGYEIDMTKKPDIKKGDVVQYEEKGLLGEDQPLKAKGIGAIDFDLFQDEGYEFVNKSMNDELIKAIKIGNYEDAKKYMRTIQEKFQDFGASDSEPNAIVDSILENYFFGDE